MTCRSAGRLCLELLACNAPAWLAYGHSDGHAQFTTRRYAVLLAYFGQNLLQSTDIEQVPALCVQEAAASLALQPWSAATGTQCWPARPGDTGMPA